MPMSFNDAVKRYMQHCEQGRESILKIMKWDETKTCDENAEMLKIVNRNNTRTFGRRYKLSWKVKNAYEDLGYLPLHKAVCDLFRSGWKKTEIENLFNLSREKVRTIILKYHDAL